MVGWVGQIYSFPDVGGGGGGGGVEGIYLPCELVA